MSLSLGSGLSPLVANLLHWCNKGLRREGLQWETLEEDGEGGERGELNGRQ
jgi:hypothetical protein